LLVSLVPQIAQASDAPIERLIYGDTVSHVFTPDINAFQFSFDAVKGDLVTITVVGKPDKVNAPIIDPALALFDPTGQLTAQNDDSLDPAFGLTNARLSDFPIPANGLYSIRVTRNQQAAPGNGAFTIALKAKMIDQSRGTVSYSQGAHGIISATLPTIRYAFHAKRGDVVIGQVKGAANGVNGALSPMLTMLDPTNITLLSASTTKSTVTVLALGPVLIAQDDVYTLAVSRTAIDKRTTPAAFEVSIARDRSGVYMAYGDQLSDIITADASEKQYVFQGQAGDTITVSMIPKDTALNARLTLRTENDKSLTTAQNSSGKGLKANDAQITAYRLPAAGVYVIAAGRVGANIGAYTLQLTLTKAGP
jgi:hypothetical protein